ncbi:MAG TPA: BamA/TamA family outer membrane protein [bacterium]
MNIPFTAFRAQILKSVWWPMVLVAWLLAPLTPDALGQTTDSTRQLLLEKIEIVGNSKTDPEVIYRYLTIRPGDPITGAVIDENLRRLDHTNFFKDVEFYTRPGSETGKLVLVVEVKERRWPYYQFEGGYSDLNGWFFVPASLRFDNFSGAGELIGLRWVLGDHVSKLALGYRRTIEDVSLDIELFTGNQQFIHYFGADRVQQDVKFGGVRFELRGNKDWLQHFFYGYRIGSFHPEQFTDFPPQLSIPKSQVGAIALGVTSDTRDNPIYPLNGFWGALSGEIADEHVGSDLNFGKVTFDARFYGQVSRHQVVALHVKGGYAGANTPFYERFYLGGANSLRGYDDRRLTPLGWGTRHFLTSAEFRFPLSTRNFPNHKSSGVLFLDAGGIWSPGQDAELSDIFAAAGFGFRVKLPVLGTTRFDFSFPLNNVDNSDFKFTVSLGQSF